MVHPRQQKGTRGSGRRTTTVAALFGSLTAAPALTFCWVLVFAGCQPKATQTTPFGLRIAELKISNVPITVEIADTPQASENGLMFRDSLPEDHGMLFIFDQPRKASFWMRNTKIPLSIAYADSDGKILEIKSMNPLDETVVPSRSDEVDYALEVNQGWFGRHGITSGAKIEGIPRK